MVLLCALCCFINYADRVNMSVAIIAIADEYNFTVGEQGIIMSSFFMGYLPMQIGGAVLCRRFGGKNVLAYGAFFWSMFTILTPVASHLGYYPLVLCRILMGFSEGVAFPAVFHFLSNWIPANERARAIAIFLSGVHVGTTTALILSPMIIKWHSWHAIFYTFGGAGFVWILLWTLIAYDRDGAKEIGSGQVEYEPVPDVELQTTEQPLDRLVVIEDHLMVVEGSGLGEGRRRGSLESLEDSPEGSPTTQGRALGPNGKPSHGLRLETMFCGALSPAEVRSVVQILSDKRCIALCFTQALFGLIHYTILSWLPSYFKHVFDADTTSLSFTFVPYATMAISSNVGGLLSDKFVSMGFSLTYSRKMVTVIANGGAAILLIMFSMAKNVTTALVFVSLSMAFMSLNTGGFESMFLDMASPSLSGMFKAVANTMASFSGFVAIPLATLILQWSGSWRVVFGSLSFWYTLMATVFCAFAKSDRVLTEESK